MAGFDDFDDMDNFIWDGHSQEENQLIALILLSSLAAVGVVVLVAAATAPAAIGMTVVAAGDLMIVVPAGSVLTETQLAIVALLNSPGIWGQGAGILGAVVQTWGFEVFTVDSLIALYAFDVSNNPHNGYMNWYLGGTHGPGPGGPPGGGPGSPGGGPGGGPGGIGLTPGFGGGGGGGGGLEHWDCRWPTYCLLIHAE